ncbi:MAG: DUF6470 family protein [Oscillospiraceae bacterium]|nr:DUF6470 family protein [Oscillospiraceae bacterium]
MQQLLSIKRIPIEIEVNVQRSELKPIEEKSKSNGSPPHMSVSRRNDAVFLKADPVKVDLPKPKPLGAQSRRVDAFNSSGGNQSFTLSYKGYAKMEQDGSAHLAGEVRTSASDMDVRINKASRSVEAILNALPKMKNNSGVSFSNGKLSIDYNVDNGVDILDILKSKFEFIPGKIEVVVTQMPKLEIEYTGGPIYFPRSADPNYEPPLVLA